MYKKFDIYYADLGKQIGSVQRGLRPVIVVSEDECENETNVVTVLPITSKIKRRLPTHVLLKQTETNLNQDSVALAEQINTVDKSILKKKIGNVYEPETIKSITKAIQVQLDLYNFK